jgi:hypothetical protein
MEGVEGFAWGDGGTATKSAAPEPNGIGYDEVDRFSATDQTRMRMRITKT